LQLIDGSVEVIHAALGLTRPMPLVLEFDRVPATAPNGSFCYQCIDRSLDLAAALGTLEVKIDVHVYLPLLFPWARALAATALLRGDVRRSRRTGEAFLATFALVVLPLLPRAIVRSSPH
jgi:hypothetical protein